MHCKKSIKKLIIIIKNLNSEWYFHKDCKMYRSLKRNAVGANQTTDVAARVPV